MSQNIVGLKSSSDKVVFLLKQTKVKGDCESFFSLWRLILARIGLNNAKQDHDHRQRVEPVVSMCCVGWGGHPG